MHKQRNENICADYVSGLTMEQCAEKYGLTKQRVRQILDKHDIGKEFRAKPKEIGLKDGVVEDESRDVFLGINVSEADKNALREEAERRGLSMSRLSSDFLKEMLAGLRPEVE